VLRATPEVVTVVPLTVMFLTMEVPSKVDDWMVKLYSAVLGEARAQAPAVVLEAWVSKDEEHVEHCAESLLAEQVSQVESQN